MTRQLVVDPASSHLSSGQIACAHPPLTPKMTDARRLWPNGLASQRKPELAYGLAMGGQADSQVGSQVHASHKNSQLSSIYSWLAISLCRLALGGQTARSLRRLAYEVELDQNWSHHKWVAKRNTSWMQVENLRRLASPFGQNFTLLFPKRPFRRWKDCFRELRLCLQSQRCTKAYFCGAKIYFLWWVVIAFGVDTCNVSCWDFTEHVWGINLGPQKIRRSDTVMKS